MNADHNNGGMARLLHGYDIPNSRNSHYTAVAWAGQEAAAGLPGCVTL
jgi:hypothetical protein